MTKRNANDRKESAGERKGLEALLGSGGWVEFGTPALAFPVFARFEPNRSDGRLEIVELHLGTGRMDAADLRRVPFGSMAATANHPDVKPRILADMAEPVEAWTHPKVQRSILDQVDYRISDLVVPAAKPYPDAFYEKVAEHYQRLVRETPRPAAVLANAAGVPVTTAHAWIKRARDRGYLPQGRKGARG